MKTVIRMSRPIFASRNRARSVVVWTVVCYTATQLATAGLSGYPWPTRTEPEIAVRTERFSRHDGWLGGIPTLEESVIQWQVFHALTAAEPQDVIFVGDSSCLMGIVPRRITQRTQLKAWNLGTIGSLSTAGHAGILELYLRRHQVSKPRLVVCYLAPSTLGRTREEVKELGLLDHFREWLHGADAGLAAQTPLARLPGYRLRRPLYAAADSLFEKDPAEEIFEVKRDKFPSDKGVRQALLEAHGYLVEPRKFQLRDRDPVADSQIPTADSIAGIVRMFALTQALSVDLLVLFSPAPEKSRGPEIEALYRRVEEQLRTAANPYANVTIQAPFLRYYPDAEFGSRSHLTEAGASRNSDEIVAVIRERLDKRVAAVEPRP